ncbi:MAG: hypothetical protein RBR67_17810 [Desulfobacterium sp.]|nr:hypothetical protein [Desulfobacterium sp.]
MLNKETIASWKKPPQGFFQWLQDVKPQIPSFKGGFEVFQPTDDQMDFFNNALATDSDGNFIFQTIVDSEPRRHSKTIKMALLVLWRFSLFPNQTVAVMANSTVQAQGVSYKLLKQIILNTKFLREQIGTNNVQGQKIIYPALQSEIVPVSTAISGLYGKKISIAWITEIHACPDPEAPQVLASSIGDTQNSWYLIDSTVDSVDGPLHNLEKLKNEDETIYYHKVEYKNLQDALKKSPPWIDKKWLASRQKQLLPATFNSQHLNKRGQAENSLFNAKDLKRAMEDYKNPLTLNEFLKIAEGRKFVIGAGLDRAMSFSKNADQTVWTVTAKIQDSDTDDAEFYVLKSKSILGSLASSIKKTIKKDFEEYNLINICLESYNSQDIHHWCLEQGFPTELTTPSPPVQGAAFLDLASIVSENRFHYPKSCIEIFRQAEFFQYQTGKAGYFKFGSKHRKDDFVYSLVWAIYSLRKQELGAFELDCITCQSKSKHASLCFLRNGDSILSCSDTCPAFVKTNEMYQKFKNRNIETDLTLPQFFKRRVKLTGTKSYRSI